MLEADFKLWVSPPLARGDSFVIHAAVGNSVGTSSDRSATVVLLGEAHQGSRAAALATAFVNSGRNFEACLDTKTAAVVLDQTSGDVKVVVAPIGLRQVYWSQDGAVLSLAGRPHGLRNFDARRAPFRAAAVVEYLYFHM